MKRAWWLAVLLAVSRAVAADAPPPPPDLNQRATYEQRLGAQLHMTTPLRDASGHAVTLAGLTQGKPLVLAFGYYRCPNLCDGVLRGIAAAVAAMPLQVGADYLVAFVSIDARDAPVGIPESARRLARLYPQAHIERWHWLTGPPASLQALARAVGFHYFYDARNQQFAHPAGIVVLTGQGRVAQYFFGVAYPSRSLRLALVHASHGQLGNVIDRLVLLCCGYDPTTGRYSVLIGRVMQVMGVSFTVLMIAGLLWHYRAQA